MSEQQPKAKHPRKTIIIFTTAIVLVVFFACVWLNQLYMIDSLKAYLNDLRDVAAALTQIIALLLLAGFVVMLTLWLSKSEGTIVLPFQNATGDAKYDGRGISDSLIAELQRIRQIHAIDIEGVQFEFEEERITLPAGRPNTERKIHDTKFAGVPLEKEKITLTALTLHTESVSSSVADIGVIGIGDTTVSVGKLLTTLKRMWPFGEPGSFITGSIQKYGPVYRLVARMEDRNGIRTWTVTRPVKRDSEITNLVRDLAYQIALGLSPEITASAEGFALFSESWNDYSVYRRTGNVEDLIRAENECLDAYKHDHNYAKLAGLFFNFGIEELNRNEYSKAIHVLEHGTNLRSDNARGFFSLGYAYDQLGNYENAIAAYQRSIALDPKDAAPHNRLGDVFRILGRINDALTEYQRAIELDPSLSAPYNGLGYIHYILGRADEALAAFQRTIKLSPQSAKPSNNLGNIYNDLGRTDEAIYAYQHAADLDPKDAAPHNGLGNVYARLDRFDDAFAEYKIAIDLDPKLAAPYIGLGNVYANLGRIEDAIASYQRAIELDPKFPYPYHNLGNVYYRLGRINDAIAAFQHAINLDPTDAAPHIDLGNMYADLGRINDAFAEYQSAIKADPKSAMPYNNLGKMYADLGRIDEAIVAYQRAIELRPGLAYPYYNLGNVYRGLGRTDEAIAEYQRAIELDPKDATPHNGLGNVYRNLGRVDDALVEYQRAIELDPNDATARSSLVACLRKLGREAEAAQQEKIARELIGKESEYNRACFEAICGNADEALALLKVALDKKQASRAWARRDPDFENIRTDPRFVALVGAADEGPSADSSTG